MGHPPGTGKKILIHFFKLLLLLQIYGYWLNKILQLKKVFEVNGKILDSGLLLVNYMKQFDQ